MSCFILAYISTMVGASCGKLTLHADPVCSLVRSSTLFAMTETVCVCWCVRDDRNGPCYFPLA